MLKGLYLQDQEYLNYITIIKLLKPISIKSIDINQSVRYPLLLLRRLESVRYALLFINYSLGGNHFIWWIADEFSGHSYEKVKVKFFFFDNIIKTNIRMLPPPEDFLSKPINLRKKRIKNINIESDTITNGGLDGITVYYRLPWVAKPEIKLVDNGINFLVKPTRNPIYRTIHTIIVTGLTLRNIGLRMGEYFRHIFLTWPFFSSYIWTFVVTAAICFLIGFGIFKLKVFRSRRSL